MATSRVFNILVAEDEGFQRLALLDILTLCDYEGMHSGLIWVAIAVENGSLALAELKNDNIDYDLVLLDLYMPIMDGFELLSIMKNDDRLKNIPVVVMSANDSTEIIAGCLSNSFQKVITFYHRNGSQRFHGKTHSISRVQGTGPSHEINFIEPC
jgi:CheY-like chemotaxis protein